MTVSTFVRPRDARHGDVAACLWLLVVSVALQVVMVNPRISAYDEGLILYGGARIARGGMPYRDFWSLYGPASYFVVGGIFHLFGESVQNARIYDGVCRSIIVVLAFLNVRLYMSTRPAFVTALLVLLLLIALETYEFPVYPATAFALLAVWITARHSGPTVIRPAWLCAGFACGIALTFRTDMGVYVFLACLYAAVRQPLHGSDRVATVGYLLAGAGSIVVPVLIFLFSRVPLGDLYQDFIEIAFRIYGPNRTLPFPGFPVVRQAIWTHNSSPLSALAVYLPIVIAVPVATVTVRNRLRAARVDGPIEKSADIGFETLVLLSVLFILKGLIRVSIPHMGPAILLSLLTASILLSQIRQSAFRIAIGVIAFFLIGQLNGLYHRVADRVVDLSLPAARTPQRFACPERTNARMGCFTIDDKRMAALAYIENHVREGETIYIGARRHDKLFINDVELYFLSGARAPTKWFDLHPGVQTQVAIQKEMIADFQQAPPRLVVLDSTYDDANEPNLSAKATGVHLLDDYIARNFAVVDEIGPFLMMKPVLP